MSGSATLASQLPPDLMVRALELTDYMLGDALKSKDADLVLTGMSERIRAAGVPLDRATSIVPLLHAEAVASARFWERGKGARSYTFPFNAETGAGYARSPAAEAHETGQWVTLWLPETSDEKYDIVAELKADGFTHYVMMPVFMANGMANTFSFATRAESGFSETDFAFFRVIFPAISACQEILATHRIMSEVMQMYVGREPYQRILSGDVHRGDVMRIRSAILFADMRRFTELTADMSAEEATDLLNTYYDCVVPAIERHQGEVLKFIGDGILAIFPVDQDVRETCVRALAGATAALNEVARAEARPAFEVGIALHLGEVAFGNVGSGMRLDYTVIGRDVNLASRLASLCGSLSEPLLVSEMFRQHFTSKTFRAAGRHAMKGLKEKQAVFAPYAP